MSGSNVGEILIGMGIDLANLKSDVSRANSQLDKLSGTTEAQAKKTASVLGSMAGSFGAIIGGHAVWNTLKDGIKTIAEFQTRMQNVSTLISGQGTRAISELKNGILELTRELPKSADELGASAYDIFSAGITDTSDAMKVLRNSAMLSIAGLGDQKTATDLMTSAINAFGYSANDADQVAAILFNTVKMGKTTVADMASQFGAVASNAKGASVSFEDLQAMTAALTAVGLPTSQAQTRLSAAFIETSKGGNEFESALKKVGLSLTSFKTLIGEQGFVGALEQVRDKSKLTNEDFKLLFGSAEAGGAIFSLLTSANDGYTKSLESMPGAWGNFAAAVEKNKVGILNAQKDLSNSWANYNIRMGEALGATSLVEAAIGTLSETIWWLADGSWGADIAGQFPIVAETFNDFMMDMESRMRGGEGIFESFGGVINDASDNFYDYALAIVMSNDIIRDWAVENAAAYASVRDEVYATIELWSELKSSTDSTWNSISSSIENGWDWAVTETKNAVSKIVSEVKRLKNEILEHSPVPDLINGIEQWFGRLPNVMVKQTHDNVNATIDEFSRLTASGLGLLVNVEAKPVKAQRPDRERKGPLTPYDLQMQAYEENRLAIQATQDRIDAELGLNELLTEMRAERLTGAEYETFRENELYAQQITDFNEYALELLNAKIIDQEQIDSWNAEIDAAHNARMNNIRMGDIAWRAQMSQDTSDFFKVIYNKSLKHKEKMYYIYSSMGEMMANLTGQTWIAMIQQMMQGGGLFSGGLEQLLRGFAKQWGEMFIMKGFAAIAEGVVNTWMGLPNGPGLIAAGKLEVAAGTALAGAAFIGGGMTTGGTGMGGGDSDIGLGNAELPNYEDYKKDEPLAEATPAPSAEITPLAEQTEEEALAMRTAELVIDLGRLRGKKVFVEDMGELTRELYTEFARQQKMGLVKLVFT